jgi:RNA recognition motif-containing protein
LREQVAVGWTDGNLTQSRRGPSRSIRAARNGSLKKLYIGNLPFTATEEELRELFEQHGPTVSVRVITDRETGRSRGFGFVEFDDSANAEKALQALDGQEMDGRPLRVNEAQDRERGGGGGGGRR